MNRKTDPHVLISQIQLPGPLLSPGLLKEISGTVLLPPSMIQNASLTDKDSLEKHKHNNFISL